MGKYWVAVVICQTEKRILSSFLTFWADNRFKALEAVKTMLPDNPEYLDASGELRPFSFLELRQVKEKDAVLYQNAFFDMFSDVQAELSCKKWGHTA